MREGVHQLVTYPLPRHAFADNKPDSFVRELNCSSRLVVCDSHIHTSVYAFAEWKGHA